MKFICDQDWDSMHPTLKGRFCHACNKEVIDYSGKSLADILKDKQEKEHLCGRFRVDQVDPSIISEIDIPRKIRSLGVISALLFTVFSKTSFGQTSDPNRTEQTENKDITTTNNDSLTTAKPIVKQSQYATEINGKPPFLTTNKKRYFWSKKFPFIVTTKVRYFAGKF